jgi:hypothetical protein
MNIMLNEKVIEKSRLKSMLGLNYETDVEDIRLTKHKNEIRQMNNKILKLNESRIINDNFNYSYIDESQLKIVYNDRFFIYPSFTINKTYYKIKYNNRKNIIFNPSLFTLKKVQTKPYKISNNSFSILCNCESLFEEIKREYEQKFLNFEKQIKLKEDEINLKTILYDEFITKREVKLLFLNIKEIMIRLSKVEEYRKNLNNYIHSIKGNLRVYCRVKPSQVYII